MDELVDIKHVEVLGNQRLRLTYVDGLVGDVNFQVEHWHGVLAPLAEPEFFAKVFVNPQTGTLTWPGELDLAPEPLRESARENQIEPASPPPPAPDRVRVLYRQETDYWHVDSPDMPRWNMTADSYEQAREIVLETIPFTLACEAEQRGEGLDEARFADIPIEHFVLEPVGVAR